jgi:hypothetical protein
MQDCIIIVIQGAAERAYYYSTTGLYISKSVYLFFCSTAFLLPLHTVFMFLFCSSPFFLSPLNLRSTPHYSRFFRFRVLTRSRTHTTFTNQHASSKSGPRPFVIRCAFFFLNPKQEPAQGRVRTKGTDFSGHHPPPLPSPSKQQKAVKVRKVDMYQFNQII